MTKRREVLILLMLMIISGVLRVIALDNDPIWLGEAIKLREAKKLSFDFFRDFLRWPYILLLHFWYKIVRRDLFEFKVGVFAAILSVFFCTFNFTFSRD